MTFFFMLRGRPSGAVIPTTKGYTSSSDALQRGAGTGDAPKSGAATGDTT